MKPPRSLKARALQLLSQREQSRVELRRKLLAHLKADEVSAAQARAASRKVDEDGGGGSCNDGGSSGSGHGGGGSNGSSSSNDGSGGDRSNPTDGGNQPSDGGVVEQAPETAASLGEPADAASRIEAVLDWLEVHQFASDERFAESRVHARSARFGNLRIRQELKQHAVVLTPEAAQALAESEEARAAAVYGRRFAAPPETTAERAKRARFLAARGFSPEVVRQVVGSRRARDPD